MTQRNAHHAVVSGAPAATAEPARDDRPAPFAGGRDLRRLPRERYPGKGIRNGRRLGVRS